MTDGESPTFRQWEISVLDRLDVNSDHYETEKTRKALIWSTTLGLAREYLQPRYRSGYEEFETAAQMLELLESYFTTGYETDQFRDKFLDIKIGDKDYKNKTFANFAVRFYSKAVLRKESPGN